MLEKVTNYDELLQNVDSQDFFMVYVMSEGCSVCHADFPKVQDLAKTYSIPSVYMMINEIPEAVGQLSLFTSPVVILYFEGKEIHRQARFINFEELEYRVRQVSEL
ncbi:MULTISPECIES: thioredoxin family protein [Staphylococcus]|uniref:Thioredoxin family protein n=1 Tax=Staphylococcus hsinchuensis TaxID=3051183 RepID=A0ABZ3EE73_9STAP|nr:thioredoxin family protein [Staphylococcus sp. Marseille-Q6910]